MVLKVWFNKPTLKFEVKPTFIFGCWFNFGIIVGLWASGGTVYAIVSKTIDRKGHESSNLSSPTFIFLGSNVRI